MAKPFVVKVEISQAQFKALCWDALKENTLMSLGVGKNNFSTTLYEFMQSIEAMEKDLLKNELTSIKD